MVLSLHGPAWADPGVPAGPLPGPAGTATLPCTYCRQPIEAASFGYLSAGRRLLSASCPSCEREVRVLLLTWRRLSRSAS